MSNLNQNTTDLQTILNLVNQLPEPGNSGIDTSDATATADEIFIDKTAYVNGQKLTGTFTIDDEIDEQTELLNQVTLALQNKSAGGGTNTNILKVLDGSVKNITAEDLGDITSLRNYAFYGCTSLISVRFPSTLTKIGTYCFYNNSSLQDVVLPNTITSIGARSFYNCELSQILIPSSITNIPAYAFNGNSNLGIIILEGDSVKTLAALTALNGTLPYDDPDNYPIYIKTISADPATLIAQYEQATNWVDNFTFAEWTGGDL